MKIRQTQKLSQKLSLTPQMKQSLRILQMPILELKSYLETQIEENPVLEEQQKPAKNLEETSVEQKIKDFLALDHFPRETANYNSPDYANQKMQDKQRYLESLIAKKPTLQEHLLQQLRLQHLNPKELTLGKHLISYIDENGYLKISLDDALSSLKKDPAQREIGLAKAEVEKVLALIQTFEPHGVGARNLKECLLIQLKAKNKTDSLAYLIIEHYLVELAQHKLKSIGKKLKKSLSAIEKAQKEIAALEPKPGRAFWHSSDHSEKTIIPDVIVEKVAGKFEIITNSKWIPSINISARYRKLLKSNNINDELKQYLQQKIKSALWLIKAVSQREETIRKITECFLSLQKEFLEEGDLALLKPLNLKQVAQAIGRNESTISRVVNAKYIQTPVGIFKMDRFFSSHLKTHQGEKVSTENIKSLILDLISDENPESPLKDSAISQLLKQQGINIARRTVAKYRKEIKLTSYRQRRPL